MTDRVAIMGVGAVGAAIGAYLIREGYDVTLIDQWAAHVDVMKTRGLTMTDLDGEFTVGAKALHLHEVSNLRHKFDIIYLAVKSYDTRWSTYLIEPYLKPTGFVLPAQNSLNDEIVASIVGFTRTVGCVPGISVGIYEPGHVIRTDPPTGPPRFIVGELTGLVTPRVRRVVEALKVFGPIEATTNIWGVRWAKLVVNCMMNALSGIVGPSFLELEGEERETVNLVMVTIGGEVARVGSVLGVVIQPVLGIPATEFAEAMTKERVMTLKVKLQESIRPLSEKRLGAPERPSLLQDILKGRRTEVDFLNGLVVKKGKEVGIPTPMNQTILDLTKEIEEGKTQPRPENLERIKPYLVR